MEWVPSGVLPPLGSKLLVVLLLSLVGGAVGRAGMSPSLILSTAQTSSPRAFSSSTCVETPAPPRMATGEEGGGKEVLDEPRPLLRKLLSACLPHVSPGPSAPTLICLFLSSTLQAFCSLG